MRHFTRALSRTAAALACAVALATCADAPTGPNRSGMPARLAFAPHFSASASAAASALRQAGIEVASVRVVIRRTANGDELFNRVLTVAPGASSVTLEADVVLRSLEEELTAFMEFLDATGTVLYRGEQRVVARAGNNEAVTVDAEIEFVGPGSTAASVRVSPADTAISTATPLPLQAVALDATGAPIASAILLWSSSDAALATVSATGIVTPRGPRGIVQVSARTPLGIAGAATLRLMPPAARIALIGGPGQTGPAGTTLAEPFTVEVQAADGLPVPGETVTFSAVTTGGSVTSTTVTTDAQGRASTPIKLGTAVGRYEFRAVSGSLGAVTIAADAVPGTAAKLAILSGDSQSATVGTALAAPLVVKVRDTFGNPVAGATVRWQRLTGGGAPSAASSISDASGHAAVAYTVGNAPATETVKATLDGTTTTVTFTATAVLGAASQIAIVAGDGQTGDEGSMLATALVVMVKDALGNPVPGAAVTWSVTSGNATVAQATTSTDANAKASNTVTLGNPAVMPASVVITASLASGASVTFGATIVALPPVAAQLKLVSQPSSVAVGAVMSPPLSVRIADAAGVSIAQPGVSVTASVYAPSASVGPADRGGMSAVLTTMRELVGTTTVTTDATGTATFADLALTGSAGEVQVAFSAAGLAGAVSSSIMLVAGAPQAIAMVSGDAQSAQEGTALPAPLVVVVSDVAGNATPGATVTWAVTSGNASVAQPTTTTDASATTSNTVTLGTPATFPATAVITATIPSGASATFNATITPAPLVPAKLVITQQPPVTVRSGIAFGSPVNVQVADSAGTPIPVAGQVVTAAVYSASVNRLPADGNFAATALQSLALSGTTSVATDASGVASFADLTITGVEGPVTLSFSSGSLPVVSSNTVTLAAGDAATIAILPSTPTAPLVVTSGQPIADNVWLETSDASGNRVPDVPVRFVTRSGGADGPIVGDSTLPSNGIGEIAGASFPVPAGAGTYHLTVTIPVAGAPAVTFSIQVNASTAGATVSPVGATTIPINVGPVAIGSRSVVVRDSQGAALPGLDVTYSLPGAGSNGSFTGDVYEVTAVTDASGVASFPSGILWTPPAPEGSYVMTVVARDGATQVGSSVTFTAVRTQWTYRITATPATPEPATNVALVAQLVDGNGANLTVSPARDVTWSLAVGSGAPADFATTTLAADGSTGTGFTSDAAPGAIHTVKVTDNSYAITGTTTVTNAGSSAAASIGYGAADPAASGDLQVAPAGDTLGQALVVKVLDGNGAPLANAAVEWRHRSSLSAETVLDTTATDASGIASLRPVLPVEESNAGHIFEASPVATSLVLRFRAVARNGSQDAIWFGPAVGDGSSPLGYSEWAVASSWSSGAVPGSTSSVLIPAWDNSWVASPQLTGNAAVAQITTPLEHDFPYLSLGTHELSVGGRVSGALVEGTGTIRMTGTSASINVHAPGATLAVAAGAHLSLAGFTRVKHVTVGGTLQVGVQSLQLEGGELLVSGQLLMSGGAVYGGSNVVFDNTSFDSTNTGTITFGQLFEQRGTTKLVLPEYFTVTADVAAPGSMATIRFADSSSSLGALVVTGPDAGTRSTLAIDGAAAVAGDLVINGLVNVTGPMLRLASDNVILPGTADLSGLATLQSRGYYAPIFAGPAPQTTESWAAELNGASQYTNLRVNETMQVYGHPFHVSGNLDVAGPSGALRMMGQADTVDVRGSLTFASDVEGNLRDGVIRIGGDLSYLGTADFRPDTLSTGTKIVFDGGGEQKVTVEPQLRGAVAYLGNLEVPPGSTVRQATSLTLKGLATVGGTWIADSGLVVDGRIDVAGGETPGRLETHAGTNLRRLDLQSGAQWWNGAGSSLGLNAANFFSGSQIWNYAGDGVVAEVCYNAGYVLMDNTQVYFSCTLNAPYGSAASLAPMPARAPSPVVGTRP